MKIVQFNDGRYGLRKWSWSLLSFRFHDNSYPNTWWASQAESHRNAYRIRFNSVAEVKEMHQRYLLALRIDTAERGKRVKEKL